jgi:hypothetical protein
MIKQIKVFQAHRPDDVFRIVAEANKFLIGCGLMLTEVHVTETGSSAGYSYTVTVEYVTKEEDAE